MTVQFSWIASRLVRAFSSSRVRSIAKSFSKPSAPSLVEGDVVAVGGGGDGAAVDPGPPGGDVLPVGGPEQVVAGGLDLLLDGDGGLGLGVQVAGAVAVHDRR